LSVGSGVPLALAAGALGQAGDLGESLIKRSTGVKDSGAIVPRHGGIFHPVDAPIFTSAVGYFYTLLGLAPKERRAASIITHDDIFQIPAPSLRQQLHPPRAGVAREPRAGQGLRLLPGDSGLLGPRREGRRPRTLRQNDPQPAQERAHRELPGED